MPIAGPARPVVQVTHESSPADELETRIAALEADLEKRDEADQKKKGDDATKPTVKFSLELQGDSYLFNQDAVNRATVGDIQDGSAFRRARVGWFGDYQQTEYRIEFDIAQTGRPTFLDVWAGWKELPILGTLHVGHFFEPFSLERMTSNRFTTFMERGLPDQPFVPARNFGIASSHVAESERATWAAGIFRTNSDVFGDDVGDNGERSFTTRATWLPYFDEPSGGRYYAHLGAGYSFRDADGDTAQFRSQPEARLGTVLFNNVPFFVDTGLIPAHYWQLLGLEAAWVAGPFSLQGEWIATAVNRTNGPDPEFSAYYVTASYFLTGEHRPYRKMLGAFDRVIPFEEAFRVRSGERIIRGRGAWEVAARVSHVDLNNAGIAGGELTDLTLGLNWYLTASMRFTCNYVHAFLDNPIRGESEANIFGARIGYEF